MSTLSWYVWLPTSVLEGALGLTATPLCQDGPASPKRLPFTVQATNVSSPKPKKLPKTPKSSSRRRILTPSLCSASPSGRSEPAAELKQTIESLRRERDEATATGCRLREANKLLVTRLKEVTSSDKSAPTATQPSPARLPAGGFLRFHSWCPPLRCDSVVLRIAGLLSPRSSKKMKMRDFRVLQRRASDLEQQLQRAVEESRHQLDSVRAANAIVVKGLRDSNTANQNVITVLQAEKDRLVAAGREAGREMETLRADLARTKEEFESARLAHKRELTAAQLAASQQQEELQHQLDAVKQQMEFQKQDMTATITNLQDTVEQLKQDNTAAAQQSAAMKEALNAKRDEARSTFKAAQLAAAVHAADRRQWEAAGGTMQDRAASMQEQLEEAQSKLKAARGAAVAAKKAAAAHGADMEDTISTMKAEIQRLNDTIEAQVCWLRGA